VLEGTHSRLSPQMAASLQRRVELSELQKALIEMAIGKSLGPDGITVELYECMWPIFREEYLRMLQDSITRGSLPPCITEG
jgi:hypothetical protein